jgi:hypothetical protein
MAGRHDPVSQKPAGDKQMEFRNGANTPMCDALLSDTTGCRKRRKRQVRWLAITCLGMVFGSLTLRTGADTTICQCGSHSTPLDVKASVSFLSVTYAAVYLFDTNNNPVLSPNTTIFEGGVFTDAGFIGTVDADFNIVDTNDVIIGYVNYPSPG